MAALIVKVKSTNSFKISDNILACKRCCKKMNFGQKGVNQEAKGSRKIRATTATIAIAIGIAITACLS